MKQLEKEISYKNNEDKEKKTFFDSFKKLFSKMLTMNQRFFAKPTILSDRSQINNLIEIKNYNIIYHMISSGYQITNKEKRKIEAYLGEKLEDPRYSYRDYTLLDSFIKLGFSIPDKSKCHFFSHLLTQGSKQTSNESIVGYYEPHALEFFNSNKNISLNDQMNFKKELTHLPEQLSLIEASNDKSFKYLTHELKTYIHNNIDKVVVTTFDDCVNRISSYNRTSREEVAQAKLKNMLQEKNQSIILNSISLSNFLEATKQLNNKHSGAYSSLQELCNTIINSWYKEDINLLLKNSKNTRSIINQQTQKLIAQEIAKIDVNNIPKEAENLLEEINQLYNNLKSHNKVDYDINNLFENKIPEILKKYLIIDEDNRKTLKNTENKNAEELMIDSLSNIKQFLEKKYIEFNEDALSSLSATNRYTKKIN